MYKRLLFFIAGSSSVASGLGSALTVSTEFGAQLDVIFCRRSFTTGAPVVADYLGVAWQPDSVKIFEKDEKHRVSAARKVFDQLTQERNVPYRQYPSLENMPAASWEISKRPPTEELLVRAGATDMVVVGRSADGVGDVTRLLTETALFACGQPVLIAPLTSPKTIGKHVFIGWNRSTPSARAVKNALPFLQKAQTVTLFMVDTGTKDGPEPDAIAQYLALHNVHAKVVVDPRSATRVSENLLIEADKAGADLLVMGAFSHSRLWGFVLGGVTEDILKSASLPVLMSH